MKRVYVQDAYVADILWAVEEVHNRVRELQIGIILRFTVTK